MKVVVNGIETAPGRAVQNWGELLAMLDDECAGQGVVVTEVTFDGVAQPSFREPEMAEQPVEALRIDVDTARQTDLVLSAVGDALRALEPLHGAARHIADAYRRFDIDEGNRGVAGFARNLASLVELTGAISAVSGLEAASLSDVSEQVDRLIAARDAGDWVTAGDVMAHDVTAVLDQWRGVLAALHRELLEPSASL